MDDSHKRQIFEEAQKRFDGASSHPKVREGLVSTTALALEEACHHVKASSADDAGIELYSDELHGDFERHLEKEEGE